MTEADRMRREMLNTYPPPVTVDDLPSSLESRAQHRRVETQLRGRVEFWQAQVTKEREHAVRVEAALAECKETLERIANNRDNPWLAARECLTRLDEERAA